MIKNPRHGIDRIALRPREGLARAPRAEGEIRTMSHENERWPATPYVPGQPQEADAVGVPPHALSVRAPRVFDVSIAVVLNLCLGIAASSLTACLSDTESDLANVGSARGALGEIPADAFDNAVVRTEGHPGWTEGSSGVTHDGAATYELPIQTPSGRNGIEPHLALAYNSRDGDGLLGTGWSLSGLSMITRCARNERLDGAAGGVEFGPEDALCLDGERLVRSSETGFTHRKWRNGYERIQLRNRSGLISQGLPSYDSDVFLTVWSPDGTIRTYGHGNRPNVIGEVRARQLGSVNLEVTYAWLLTRVEDRHGNYLTIDYSRSLHPDGSVEVVPVELTYTGHEPSGLPGRRSVRFEYEARPPGAAHVVQWIERFGMRTTQRLSAIEVRAPGSPAVVRRYLLRHDVSRATNSARLVRLQECDGFQVCRDPLVFSYDDGAVLPAATDDSLLLANELNTGFEFDSRASIQIVPGLVPPRTRASQFDSQWNILVTHLDASRDRIFSEVRHGMAHGELWSADRAGAFVAESIDRATRASALIAFDYDRDGVAEFLRLVPGGQQVTWLSLVKLEAIQGVWTSRELRRYPACQNLAVGATVIVADLDGNGVGDFVTGCQRRLVGGGSATQWYVTFHDGTNYGEYADPTEIPLGWPVNVSPTIVDWDADGRQELHRDLELGGEAWGLSREGRMRRFYMSGIPRSNGWIEGHTILDANGDGLPDLLTVENRVPTLRLNNGGGRLSAPQVAISANDPDAWIWAEAGFRRTGLRQVDMNADGRDDFLYNFDIPTERYPGTEVCDPGGSGRCLDARQGAFASRDGYYGDGRRRCLAHISTGESFRTMRCDVPPRAIVDLGSDGLPDFVYERSDSPYQRTFLNTLRVHPGPFRRVPDLLREVGRASSTEPETSPSSTHLARFSYRRVSRAQQPCVYPVRCVTDGLQVVYEHTDARGHTTRHSFRDPGFDLTSRQLLGFTRHYVENRTTRVMKETRFELSTFARAGFPTIEYEYVPLGHGHRVHELRFSYDVVSIAPGTAIDSPVPHRVELRDRDERSWDVTRLVGGCAPVESMVGCEGDCSWCQDLQLHNSTGARLLSHRATHMSYDAYGTRVRSRDRVYAVHGSNTSVLEENESFVTTEDRVADWIIGLPRHIEFVSSAPGYPSALGFRRREEHEYDEAGFPRRTTVDRDGANERHVERIPNSFGLVESLTERASGLSERVTTFAYDPEENIHLRGFRNAEGHQTAVAIHPGLGVPVLRVDVNGVESRTTYDGFGRVRTTSSAAAADAVTQVQYSAPPGVQSAERLVVERRTPGHDHAAREIDHLGRLHRERFRRPNDPRWLSRDVVYDSAGRVRETVGPRVEFEPSLRRTYTYDALDRVTRIEMHDYGPDITYAYDGWNATITDRRGNQTFLEHDELGRLKRRICSTGGNRSFSSIDMDRSATCGRCGIKPQGSPGRLGTTPMVALLRYVTPTLVRGCLRTPPSATFGRSRPSRVFPRRPSSTIAWDAQPG